MTIYAFNGTTTEILSSKPHNPHYLNRYICFIESCKILNENYIGYTEKHHICPKAKDLFPEYKYFGKHPWNLVVLTPRQHFIAHWILWKAYPKMKSMAHAFYCMNNKDGNKLDARTYARLSEEHSKNSSESARKRVSDGTNPFLGGEIQRKTALKRVSDGTNHFLGGEIQRKRVADGTHHLLGGEMQRKRVREGTHNLLGSVSCYDKEGNFIMVPKEIYHNQTGPIEDWDYVSVRSKEAKRRQQTESSSQKIHKY